MNPSYSFENNNDFEIQFPFLFSQNDTISIDENNSLEYSFNFCPKSIDFKQKIDNNNNINESISINKKIIEEKRDIHASSNFNGKKNINEKHQFPVQNIKNFSITEKQNHISILPCKNKEKDIQKNNIEILIEKKKIIIVKKR